ncbi:MAG: hypothetical protein ABS84_04285 [Rubrivivax sp. SCN 71-131]|nr:MAG: hypothetical protein ABS84_04285 [Rubrivivax sp. SCN 71-131]
MHYSALPALGQPLEGGIFCGLTTLPDGTHHAVVLLPDKPDKVLTWKQAMAWAKKLKASLPSRAVSALLFATRKADFEPAWHWTCEEFDGSYAWNQDFDNGYQDDYRKSFAGRARAVRRLTV